MIGIDITTVKRFRNRSQKFVEKILSPLEIIDYEKNNLKDFFLATRWSLKEAIFKADNKFVQFNKITIVKINKKYKFENFELSTSKENDQIIAIAIKRS